MSICSIQPIDVFLSSTVVWNWAYQRILVKCMYLFDLNAYACTLCMYI